MGQYYNTLIERDKNIKVYDRKLDGEYMWAKLMEHSWWENDWLKWVCNDIYNSPAKVAWIGDYANSESYDDESGYNGHISLKELDKLHRIAYNDKKIEKGLTKVDFDMQDKFLVNHDKKEYVDLNKYKKNSTMKGGWCIHPLSILTCYGNGLGGGDYNCPTDDSTIEFVGAWGWDLIEITDDAPESYTEVNVIFKEKGWE